MKGRRDLRFFFVNGCVSTQRYALWKTEAGEIEKITLQEAAV
jgi:hypothetical protein